jgi:hypothetical protein
MVVVEKVGQKTRREDFDAGEKRKAKIDALMSQAIDQIYKSISQNIKAKEMTIGDREDLSNETAIKFYISTLHSMPTGKPIIVAGIHALPFANDYAVNFVMTAFLDKTKKAENDLLTFVFNSFRLVGEPKVTEPGAAERSPETGGS